MRTVFSTRIRFLFVAVFLLAALLVGKLFFVQMVHGDAFSRRAENQYSTPVADTFERNTIYFRKKGSVPPIAATQKTDYAVALHPDRIGNPEALFDALSPILPELDEEKFFIYAGKKGDPYEEIAHRVDEETAERINSLALEGVDTYRDKWRFYPMGTLAAHLVGFVGYNGEYFGGRYGVERSYNDALTFETEQLQVNFFAEMFANIRDSLFYEGIRRRGDVVLTLELEVQRFLEHEIDTLVAKWNPESAGGIIIHPKTGSLYAIAARPTFDPNAFEDEEDYSVFSNPLVENVYELGSIMKPLTMAAGLDAGAVAADDMYYDRGYVLVDDARIENYDGKGRGNVTMQEVLNQSLNTGAVYVMKKVGAGLFADYLLRFGLGEETGIDVPNEVYGLVGNLKSPRTVEYATASFGQGIAVTPIAMTRALSALANDGILVTPHVVNRIEHRLGSYEISFGGKERVITEETSEEITRMLVRVVDEALLGGTVKLPRYSVAAKTGTAQIAKTEGGGYYDDRFLHSFFGYFPAYDPRFLIFLYVENPKKVRYASQTLTGPFMDTVKFLVNYYEIPPDR